MPATKDELERLLALGVNRRDLSTVARFVAYEVCFQMLYLVSDPGIGGNRIRGLELAATDALGPADRAPAETVRQWYDRTGAEVRGENLDQWGASPSVFLWLVWDECIRGALAPLHVENARRDLADGADGFFGNVGGALDRIVELGATPNELHVLGQAIAASTASQVLELFTQPGVEGNRIRQMFENLLTADPSGRDGAPERAD